MILNEKRRSVDMQAQAILNRALELRATWEDVCELSKHNPIIRAAIRGPGASIYSRDPVLCSMVALLANDNARLVDLVIQNKMLAVTREVCR